MTPRLMTPRDLSCPTDGAAGAFIAHMHGRPWFDHQRATADVIGELLPNGHYRYPIVVVLWPRQCGKTTWVMDVALGRCLQNPDYRVAYAAQTGHVTTERMGDRFLELADGPLSTRVKTRRSAGTERATLPGRSYLKAFPPKAGALRSSALDLVIVDEAQEHGTVLGEQLDLTIIPTFTTRPRRQLILIGTAGTDTSDYLRRYLKAARAGESGYAVIEYGAPDDADTDAEETWQTSHPGLACGLTDLAALRQARAAMGPAGFAREYMNRWTRTGERTINPTDWDAVQVPADAVKPAGRWCLALDVDSDRSTAAIAAATPEGDLELIEHRAGLDWTVARVLDLQSRYGYPVAARRYGAAGPIVDALERAGADLILMTAGDAANASAALADAITSRDLRIIASVALTDAANGAVRRVLPDSGGFTWSRTASTAPVAPLIAASYARWGADHLPAIPAKPRAYAG